MKAAIVEKLGSAPVYADFPEPTVAPGEVLVRVLAAGIHPLVRGLASGSHYGAAGDGTPFGVGVDCVGVLDDGQRVYAGFPRKPFGTMAERVAVPRTMCVPVPDGVDDAVAAASANPGMSAWLALCWRAEVTKGQTVLVLGATGVAGQMAVQLAKHLGASRVIAAGRNPATLAKLPALGADAIVSLEGDRASLAAKFREAAGLGGIDAIIDYVWGPPAEAAIEAITKTGFGAAKRVRFVQVGGGAGATITLPAAVLRSSALEITGTGGGTVPLSELVGAVPKVLELIARGVLTVEVERVPLSDVTRAWAIPGDGRRTVITI